MITAHSLRESLTNRLALLSYAAFLAAATTRACDALLPEISAEFDTSIAAAAIAVTAFTFAYGAFQLLYGPIGARIGTYQTATLATLLAAIGTLACAAAPSLEWLAGARAISGMTAAAIIPMSMAFIGETIAYEERQPVLAGFLSGQIMGFIFGQAFAGLFAQLLSWRQLFMLLAFGFLVIGLVLVRKIMTGTIPSPPQGRITPSNPILQYARVLDLPWSRTILIIVAIEGALCFGAFPYISAHLDQTFKTPPAIIGLVMACFGVGGILYALNTRRLLRMTGGEARLAALGGIILAAGYGLLALSPMLAPSLTIGVLPAVILIGLGFYMLHNTLQTNATQMAPFDRSAAIALFAFCLFVGQAIGAAVIGQMAVHTGYPSLFGVVGIGFLALAAVFSFLRHKHQATVSRED